MGVSRRSAEETGGGGQGQFFRLVLVGDSKVGKSSLVSRAVFDKYTEVRTSSNSIELMLFTKIAYCNWMTAQSCVQGLCRGGNVYEKHVLCLIEPMANTLKRQLLF
jgi:hypothetical protein